MCSSPAQCLYTSNKQSILFIRYLSLPLSLCAAGYIIYYSTDVNAEVHDWVIEPVVGNRLTHQIQELTLDTAYYFKIQARNSKGMGPMSEAVQFRTPKSKDYLPPPAPFALLQQLNNNYCNYHTEHYCRPLVSD